MAELVLKKSTSHSDKLDDGSILLLRNLFFNNGVKERLEEGGTLPMIDGYLELLNSEDVMEAKLTVQVKHLTYPTKGSVYYDIPNSIFAYADLNKGEVVIFIACDTDNKAFYWRYIDSCAVQEFKALPNENQQTQRYHFESSEACNEENLSSTLDSWKRIFDSKMASFKDERSIASHFAEIYRLQFSRISSSFSNLPNSHILRHEIDEIISWIDMPNSDDDSNLCVLQGNAGVGKSVVVKDIIDILDKKNVKTLCVKVDSIDLLSDDMKFDKLIDKVQYLKADQRKFVVVIDQIDALSQSLTNDRKLLDTFVHFITSLLNYKDVKVLVSCRKYDLEYDDNLRNISSNAKIITLGKLSQDEIKSVLNKLDQDLYESIDEETHRLLETAQFLNLFCKIYGRSKKNCKFNNPIQLYDAFWKILLDNVSGSIQQADVEDILFNLSRQVQEQETLNPIWCPEEATQNVLDYLGSNGAVRTEGNHVSFFHQTFYDYTLAKRFCKGNTSYVESLLGCFQGIECRSTLKAILEYDKGHDIQRYTHDLSIIFGSNRIRQHIRLLSLSMLAFSGDVLKCESQCIINYCSNDDKLLAYFLRGIQNEDWFNKLEHTLQMKLSLIDKDSHLIYPIAHCLSIASYKYSDKVFPVLNKISDGNVQKEITRYVMRGHNDYSKKFVQTTLKSIEFESNFFINSLLDALKSNASFVFEETEKLINDYFTKHDGKNNKHDSYMLVDELCKELSQNYPIEYLKMFHRCYLKAINLDAAYLRGNEFKNNSTFSNNTRDYVRKLLNKYRELVCLYVGREVCVNEIIEELLATDDEISVSIALEAISHIPNPFTSVIKHILSDNNLIEHYLHGDVEYYFLTMLKAWYSIALVPSRTSYESILLNYKSDKDFLQYRERQPYTYIYPNLWYNKWKLISTTIPPTVQNMDLRRCRSELLRRHHGQEYPLIKPDHSIPMAEFCGGLVSDASYSRFSCSMWLDTFLHLTDRWHHGRKPIDLNVHAKAFQKCVKDNPDKFITFVFNLFSNENIKPMYRIAGLKGLLDSGADIEELWPLTSSFLTLDFVKENYHDFNDIIRHYCEKENNYLDKIVEFLCQVMTSPEDGEHIYSNSIGEDKLSQRVNDLLTKAINSAKGICAELILCLCGLPGYCSRAYKILGDIEPFVSVDIKLLVLNYIYDKKYYDEEQTIKIFQEYIKNLSGEALYVCTHSVQYYWYYNPEVVKDFINKIEKDDRTHKILVQIYFYGLRIPDRLLDCESKLLELINFNEESTIGELVEICMKSYSTPELMRKAQEYLQRFAHDDREGVVKAYCFYCNKLPVEAFDFFVEIFSNFNESKRPDVTDELKYVKRCVITHPRECLKFIQSQNYMNSDFFSLIHDDVTEILLMVYRRLYETQDFEAMQSLMDSFEEMIYSGNRNDMNKIDSEIRSML